MTTSARTRFWIETALALVSTGLLLLTVISRGWIEQFFGVDPDAGSGSMEWTLVAATLCVALVSAALARREWSRRLAAVSA